MVSSTEKISSLLQETLLQESLAERLEKLSTKNQEDLSAYFEQISQSASELPSVLNKDTLQDLIDGRYDISLKDYTNLTTYNLKMSNLYGNNSANPMQSMLSNLLGNKSQNSLTTAKTLVDTLKERGYSNSDALKMYSALQSYSIFSSLNNLENLSYVSAKI